MAQVPLVAAEPAWALPEGRGTGLDEVPPRYRRAFVLPRGSRAVDHYHLWFGLRAGVKDLDFVAAAQAMLGHLRDAGTLEAFTIQRRKLGFGPSDIGEWHIDIVMRDMAQLETAFAAVAPRSGEVESLHAAVWSKVEGLKTGLYRDFPDAVRVRHQA